MICSTRWQFRFFLCVVALISFSGCSRKSNNQPIDAASLFKKRCASCHRDDNDMRAPEPEALRQMSQSAIRLTLQTGRMKWEARGLSNPQKVAIAAFLGKPDLPASAKLTGVCARDLDPPAHLPAWAGWGVDSRNTRFQKAEAAQLDRKSVV